MFLFCESKEIIVNSGRRVMYITDKVAHGVTGGSSLLKLKLCVFSYLRIFNDAFSIENTEHRTFSSLATNIIGDSSTLIKMN
jgi:hypothetical protein